MVTQTKEPKRYLKMKKFVLCTERIGYGNAMKTGIGYSTSDIVEIIDADDTYEACAIDRKYSEFFYWDNPK